MDRLNAIQPADSDRARGQSVADMLPVCTLMIGRLDVGPTVRTLRTFISSYHDLLAVIREFMLPNPDVK
ncbi:MAG TPA: hypothetical protein VFY83_12200 [Anaerolineales bacterium]|nr:hypothetical protein [Anaerolineales bacterium]